MAKVSEGAESYLTTFIFQLPFEAALVSAKKACENAAIEMNNQVDHVDIGPWTIIRTVVQAFRTPDQLNESFLKWTAETDLRIHYPDEEGNLVEVAVGPSTEDEYVFFG